ncbi:MAG TPA: MarR family winged helix-turn-helix transcriptional regulator [Candidatus Bariatricus faecipullorum]|nr:MarR family winged helix-turn-helix transcriptional regulator [Candidatus Bariatricus faecipullorum]
MSRTVESMLAYFSQIRRVYASELNLRFQEGDFSPCEISILILLSNNPSVCTGSQLGLLLGVSKGLVSRSLEALTAKGLVVCKQSDRDRRVREIRLTKEAGPLTVRLKEEIEDINREVLGDIPREEIRQVEQTLEKILKRFREKEEQR